MDKIIEKVRDIGATIAELLVAFPIVWIILLPGLLASLFILWLFAKGLESITEWWLSLWGM